MWFIGVEVEQETSAPPPKKNPGSAPEKFLKKFNIIHYTIIFPKKKHLSNNPLCLSNNFKTARNV